MLKINLIPSGAKRDGGTTSAGGDPRIFAVALGITLVVLAAGLMVFHSGKQKDVDTLKSANATRDNQVRAIKARVADHPRVRSELDEIRSRRQSIERLEANRTGPTAMLVEVSQLLSPGGRPTNDQATLERVQRDDPTRMFNPTWDPHRLWLTGFSEATRAVVIEGSGRDADDVGEFMRRLMLSQYFEQVTLERSEGSEDTATKISVQRFKVNARVRY